MAWFSRLSEGLGNQAICNPGQRKGRGHPGVPDLPIIVSTSFFKVSVKIDMYFNQLEFFKKSLLITSSLDNVNISRLFKLYPFFSLHKPACNERTSSSNL